MASLYLRIVGGCLLVWSMGNPVMADADPPGPPDPPDVAKPGGAQAGQQFNAPVPPNMRRFLARPPAKPADESLPGSLKAKNEARLSVNEIRLVGVVDRPAQGILRTELEAFVEQKRQAMLATAVSTTDITPTERARILKEIENMAGGEGLENGLAALEEKIQAMRKKSKPEGSLTLQQLQEIAAQVAQYYRDRGFILVRVVIPPQTVLQGVISLRILEGVLGNVTIEKNRNYRREQMLRPFEGLLGQPVIKGEIETAMLALNDYPGLTTFAVFRPGLHPGETDLLVSVIEERDVNSQVHVDNYGSEFTGEFRTRLDVHWNNPLNAIDKLSASLSKTINPANGAYAALNYERHAFGPKNIFGIGASKNNYSLGAALEPFGIKGTTILAQVYWRHTFQRSRLFNSYGLFQFSRKSARLDVTEGEDRADELTVASIESGFDWSSSTRRHLIRGRLQYSEGFDGLLGAMEPTDNPALTDASRRGGSGFYAGGKFAKTNMDYDHWYQFMPKHTLHFSLRAQDSNDLLTSLEQMPIGGPNSVRAYSTSEFLRDKAVSGSVEWLLRAPGFAQWKAFGNKRWGEVLQFVFFVDYAKGWLNDPLVSDREVVNLSGIGTGVRFQYEKFSARFEMASALGDEPVGNGRDPQYFFELNYVF
ncbi:MAG TPA: ShlB/FhaC/HecB family hemolysin secretion/activation protein [Gammaproteobacteria bacterium]|nr:ShlB/FhaC/HecB family hemolysin secretion/activation protein [Gammaproteobacteria bacterium]